MRCILYANEELVGWAELIYTDPPMGCVSGPFYLNDNYKKIQPVIREHNLYQLDVLGLPHDTFDRLFPLARQEYLNSFKEKEQD